MGFIKSLFKWGVIIGMLAVGIQIWITKKDYIFDEKVIEEIGKKYAGGENIPEMVNKISSELRVKYARHVLPTSDVELIFMNTGGAMCAANLLHQSATEVMVVYGTAMDTSGHPGRHWFQSNIKVVLSGSMKVWKEGTYESVEYRPGDVLRVESGEASGVSFSEGTWLLAYGRGFIWSGGPYTLADSLFSTLDFYTVFKMFRMLSKSLINECSHCFTRIIDTIKNKLLATGSP